MSPTKALETLSTLARSYKGTFEEHAHLAECTAILIETLKVANLWEENTDEVKDA
jgi:hypothetical protein